jgi:tetratricopeptide (TPR) repeat protein/Mg-chelatase subunit ChlD
MPTECEIVTDDLADLVAGDSAAIARHAEHLAGCDDCRDARHEATRLAELLAAAGADHVPMPDLVERVLAAADPELGAPASATLPGLAPAAPVAATTAAPAPAEPAQSLSHAETLPAMAAAALPPAAAPVQVQAPAPAPASPAARPRLAPVPITRARTRSRAWLAAGAAAALAAGAAGLYLARGGSGGSDAGPGARPGPLAGGAPGTLEGIERAAADRAAGVEVRAGAAWQPLRKGEPLPAGAELRTDAFTRARLALTDGTQLVLDHQTELALDPAEPRRLRLATGRLVADVAHLPDRPASIATPMGRIDVLGTRFSVTATDALTAVQVVRGAVAISDRGGKREEVRAGEEGLIEGAAVTVSAAPGLHREVEWSELGRPQAQDAAAAGLGQLRAYRPGEQRDRDWNLALASHDVKVRIVGPVARTEITESFRNDSDHTLEGVFQFPLPADAQIDGLELDVPGGFEAGAFIDKARAARIWRGVIDKATPKRISQPLTQEIIWVDGGWRDPALLDWKRGGRFELRIFPIPPKGVRTIKLSYTQVVTPRGPWRQYVYPLPHSKDGSTVADRFAVDVEVRGAAPGLVRAGGYDLQPDPQRRDAIALAMAQSGFVPRGDLVIDYRAEGGDAELRAWTFAGGAAVAPDEKLAGKQNVGIDPAVVAAQRAVAADVRPTAVLALRPSLPRWREARPRDYAIVIDASQSMVGERYARASKLAATIVDELDRRDRFTVLACDSACRSLGDLRTPSAAASSETSAWLAGGTPAGASDVVAAVRAGAAALPARGGDREPWVMYIGDGFSTTGFRRVADVERAIADTAGASIRVAAVGIGGDADAALLAAVARGGGGSYVAWVPGQSVDAAAVASLESTYGSALRGATIELPPGLADVAPAVLPTIRAGEETLVAARITGDVAGDVIVRGTVGGQPFEQRYPLSLAVSTAPGNAFVPRLWARLAIEQLERGGLAEDRTKIVALSQGYGVMSRETSLLVLESAAMFEAFGVDRGAAAAKWTGDEQLEEAVARGTIAHDAPADDDLGGIGAGAGKAAPQKKGRAADLAEGEAAWGDAPGAVTATSAPKPTTRPPARDERAEKQQELKRRPARPAEPPMGRMFAMRRTWVRVPSVAAYSGPHPAIHKAVAEGEQALAAAPDSRERHRDLVQALSYAGEIPRALDLAGKWLERDQLDPQALGYRADLLGRDGQRELALRTLAGLVDLDADRAALHERMVRAYEHGGRAAQACSHRIALAALAGKADEVRRAADAVRCLRALGREPDAALVLRALRDDATRAAAEKALTAAPPAPRLAGDLVLTARWEGDEDLDLSLIAPDGTRVSWMGGRADVTVADATSAAREQLAIRTLRRGNYLVEIGRGNAPSGRAIRGTVEIAVLGTKRSLPFELAGARAVVGRIGVSLEERLETIDPEAVAKVAFGNIAHPRLRQIMLARSPGVRACYVSGLQQNGSLAGAILLTITVDEHGSTQTRTSQPPALAATAACIQGELASMHVDAGARQTLRVPLTLRPR